MFYAHGLHGEAGRGSAAEFSIRVLESDGRLDTWRPLADPSLEEGNVLFSEEDCRDPEIVKGAGSKEYYLYYASGAGHLDPANRNEIRVRRSRDLLHWSDPITVLLTPPGYGAAESPFVLYRDNLYYLWVSGWDYARMSLYVSEDPLNFGDPSNSRIMEQAGHACQIVQHGGSDWIGCVRIGNSSDVTDLKGVYLQPLMWREADALMRGKINRIAPT